MADETTAPAGAPPAAKKKKKLGLLLAIVVGVLVAGGGAGAYWYTRPVPETDAKEVEHEAEPGGVVTFEPFVVNLADREGTRFLRIGVQLVVEGTEAAEEVEKDQVLKVRLRSKVLELLAEQTSDHLVTAEGKAALKSAIAERASAIITPRKVSDVLFTDFIVQF